MKFVVSHLDQQLGPFDEQELKMKWAAGEVLPIDYVYDEEKQDWILLADRFSWAAKPVKDDGSAPPPIREANIVKRAAPAPIPSPTPAPAPVLAPIAAPEPLTTAAAQPISVTPAPVTTTPMTPTPIILTPTPVIRAPSPVINDTKVTLVNGVAEIDFTPTTPGQVELNVKDTNGTEIRSVEPLQIHVKPLEPTDVRWEFVATQTVGQEVQVKVYALDERGHACQHYNDQYLVQVRGPVSHDLAVNMVGGRATVTLNHTKAERWSVSLHYSGTKNVRLPESCELEWKPGPAVKLVLDGPHEYLAGDPMKVRVKAVDAFGNTADTYQGTVALEVRAS